MSFVKTVPLHRLHCADTDSENGVNVLHKGVKFHIQLMPNSYRLRIFTPEGIKAIRLVSIDSCMVKIKNYKAGG